MVSPNLSSKKDFLSRIEPRVQHVMGPCYSRLTLIEKGSELYFVCTSLAAVIGKNRAIYDHPSPTPSVKTVVRTQSCSVNMHVLFKFYLLTPNIIFLMFECFEFSFCVALFSLSLLVPPESCSIR